MAVDPQPDLAKRIKVRLDAAKQDRANWEDHWEQIAERVLPHYSGSFTGVRPQGERRSREMIDSTAMRALPKFAAVMESMLTPRGSTWHSLVSMDKALRRNRVAARYFEDVTDLLFRYRYAPRANFASQMHESYMSLGAFGTAPMYIDKLDWYGEKGLRYRTIHLGEIFFVENHQGIIDQAFRRFEYTLRDAINAFGLENLPEKMREKATNFNVEARDKAMDGKHWFIHYVGPRTAKDGYAPDRLDVKGMKFMACYVAEEEGVVVEEAGHHTFPYPIGRYVVAPGETYGRSPAMQALPSIKTLNEMKKTLLKQGHRAVDPVLLAHDDGVIDGFSLKPGAINFGGVDAQGRPMVQALQTGRLDVGYQMMAFEREDVEDAFLVKVFELLKDRPQMTATEVLEIARKEGMLLSPTMGRQQSEFLGPQIEREIDVLGAQGLLPPMPQILREAKAEYEVMYDSPLSRAQRAESTGGIMRSIQFAAEIVKLTGDPAPLDVFDWDATMAHLAENQAVPAQLLATPEQIEAKRAGRQQAAETQTMIEAAPAAAGVLKALPNLQGAA